MEGLLSWNNKVFVKLKDKQEESVFDWFELKDFRSICYKELSNDSSDCPHEFTMKF